MYFKKFHWQALMSFGVSSRAFGNGTPRASMDIGVSGTGAGRSGGPGVGAAVGGTGVGGVGDSVGGASVGSSVGAEVVGSATAVCPVDARERVC